MRSPARWALGRMLWLVQSQQPQFPDLEPEPREWVPFPLALSDTGPRVVGPRASSWGREERSEVTREAHTEPNRTEPLSGEWGSWAPEPPAEIQGLINGVHESDLAWPWHEQRAMSAFWEAGVLFLDPASPSRAD